MKKLISSVLAVVMVLAMVPSAFAAEIVSSDEKFMDVPATAAYLNELNYAVANGYIAGTSDTTFSPENSITRGQFVTILGRMLNVSVSSGSTRFEDVKEGSYYAPYVAWAAESGYVSGYSPVSFGPDNNITVEQMATILTNYITKSGVELKGTSPAAAYADASSISGWAISNMEAVRQYNLLVVDSNGNVNPTKQVTRAEGVVSLVRLAKATGLGEEPTIKKNSSTIDVSNFSIEQALADGDITTAELNARVQQIHDELWSTGRVTDRMSEKEKAIVYYTWMAQNCHYSTNPPNEAARGYVHSPRGPLFFGWGVCDGLSYAYEQLMMSEGVECLCISNAEYTTGDPHMWNEVYLDGAWYHVDVANSSVMYDASVELGFPELFQDMIDKWFGTPIDAPSIDTK